MSGDTTAATCIARRLRLCGFDVRRGLQDLALGPGRCIFNTWQSPGADVLAETLIFPVPEPRCPAVVARTAIAVVAADVVVRGVRPLGALGDVVADTYGYVERAVPATWGAVDARSVAMLRWHSPVAQRRMRCCALMNTPVSPRAFPRHTVWWQWDAEYTARDSTAFRAAALSRGVTVVSPRPYWRTNAVPPLPPPPPRFSWRRLCQRRQEQVASRSSIGFVPRTTQTARAWMRAARTRRGHAAGARKF